MANAKFIDATTWGNLTEIDVTDGENLFPQLPAGTYRPVLSGVDSVTVPALSAGTIDQATPFEGDTLTVSGSNATGSATYQWQKDGVDISGATSASLDTTGEGTGDYRRGVSDGVQGPVYTSAVTVSAAAPSDSFFEDWTDAGYSINDEVATLSNWAANADLSTGGATASLFDNGGTTMLRADTANTGMRAFAYDGSATIGADRRITVQLAQLGDVTPANLPLIIDLHYANASEYMRLLVYSNGNMGFRQAGMGTSDWDRLAQAVTDTSEISLEHNSGSIICKLDGVQIGSTRTITTPPSTWSQPMIRIGNDTDNTIVESINLETLP